MVAQRMGEPQVATVSLVQLQQAIGMPLIQLWLVLGLSGFVLEQWGKFPSVTI